MRLQDLDKSTLIKIIKNLETKIEQMQVSKADIRQWSREQFFSDDDEDGVELVYQPFKYLPLETVEDLVDDCAEELEDFLTIRNIEFRE